MTNLFFSTTPRYSSLLALLALGVLVAEGCGSDSNPAPTPPTVTGGTNTGGTGAKGGSGGKGGSANTGNESGSGTEAGTGAGGSGGKGGSGAKGGSGGKGGSGAKGGSGGKGGSGNTGNESGTGNEGGTGDVSNNQGGAGAGNVSCDPVGDYQCYPCPPTTNVEYLNRCNDTSCSKFDNATRIQNYSGTLPPL